MVTTRSSRAKQAEQKKKDTKIQKSQAHKALPPRGDRRKARDAKGFLLLAMDIPAAVHSHRMRLQHTETKHRRNTRLRKLHAQILGSNRAFSGRIHIPSGESARQSDAVRLRDIEVAIEHGHALVYWADGSFAADGVTGGFLGAGVVWYEGQESVSMTYKLGRWNGNNDDAEIFAIAAALGRARTEVERGRDVQLVRVYSDSMGILQAIRNRTPCRFGPMVVAKTALEGLYERADYLFSRGIKVELIWVKGHAASDGNTLADHAAAGAIREQVESLDEQAPGANALTRKFATKADVPGIWKAMGEDWVNEWLARANASTHFGISAKERKRMKCLQQTQSMGVGDLVDTPLPGRPDASFFNFDSVNKERGFILPNLGLYGNVTLEQVIASLRSQSSVIGYQLSEIRLHQNDRSITSGEFKQLANRAAELIGHRNAILTELEAQLEVQQLENLWEEEMDVDSDEEDGRAVEEEMDKNESGDNEAHGSEFWAGDLLLAELDVLALADDQLEGTDDELERQIQDDIALAQRYK